MIMPKRGHPVDRSGGSDADYRYHYCIKQLVELLTVINLIRLTTSRAMKVGLQHYRHIS